MIYKYFAILLVSASTLLMNNSSYASETVVHGSGRGARCSSLLDRPRARRSARSLAERNAKDNARANCRRQNGRPNAVSIESVDCHVGGNCSNTGIECHAIAVAYCQI